MFLINMDILIKTFQNKVFLSKNFLVQCAKAKPEILFSQHKVAEKIFEHLKILNTIVTRFPNH